MWSWRRITSGRFAAGRGERGEFANGPESCFLGEHFSIWMPDRGVRDAMNFPVRFVVVAGLATVVAVPLTAGDWPHWRGPDRNGISSESAWLDQWPANGPKVAWKANVGLGFSSFVVGGGRVVTMGHADEKDAVFCFAADTGKEQNTASFSSAWPMVTTRPPLTTNDEKD